MEQCVARFSQTKQKVQQNRQNSNQLHQPASFLEIVNKTIAQSNIGSVVLAAFACGCALQSDLRSLHFIYRFHCRRACRTYPYGPNILVQHPCALSDYNNGATLTRVGAMHTHLFYRICNLAGPMESPLCRMCFLFLHAQRFCDRYETIIYSK